MQIAKLPEDVQSFIRTGVTITSISQCVVELVLNSLDAGASRVGVRIDLSKYELQVVDDGYGLNLEQLNLIGNRYMTSKCNTLADLQGNLKYYGYRGEAIASIKQVCDSLIIISKPKGENVTYSKVLKPNEDGNYKAVEAKLDRPGHGTTVVVINVFSNFPVRQKQLQHSLEIEQVKNELQTIALIQPQVKCLFSL
ncbi:DNA mismatch repair protein Mlh3-like [Lycorma delicatula]|uniref:DNA mismatch repair protein Mlh3-like n=1 Tax=Lycorma delicatula TaxID=130591 RepID=UPI003F517430